MIKITNLNKYFNKNSSNEYHALKDINLEFPSSGLVTIFGKSGSGKTTLLNVIGLLDKFDSGEIIYSDISFKRYSSNKSDTLRNEKIGYIFQNYNLVATKNVFDNVAMPLDLLGEKDKGEIKRKVEYALKAVGLEKFKRRYVTNLSGGQMQRVAIARAIVKNPEVIIADEPTGNLDSNNTFDVMNIIKKISKEKLVILVSHEKNLVDFYSDRIIEISDGRIISDRENEGTSLKHSDERNIYLKDYKTTNSKVNNFDLSIYDDEVNTTPVKVDIVIRDGEIYLKSSSNKIHLVDPGSEMKFLDASRKEFEENLKKNESDFSLDMLDASYENNKKKYISLFKSFRESLLSKSKFLKKSVFTIIALIIASIIFTFNLASLTSTLSATNKDYLVTSLNTVSVTLSTSEQESSNKGGDDIYARLKNDPNFISLKSDNQVSNYYLITATAFYQARTSYVQGKYYPVDGEKYPYELVYGRKVENNNEVVISKWIAEEILSSSSFYSNGYYDVEDILGLDIMIEYQTPFKIVGVCAEESYIIILNHDGYNLYFKEYLEYATTYYIDTTNKEKTIELLSEYSRVRDEYVNGKKTYYENLMKNNLGRIIFLSIIALALALYIILMVRSSMFKKIKEIGILRTVGAKKSDVLNIFLGDIISITTKTSLIVYLAISLTIVILKSRLGLDSYDVSILTVTPLSFIIGIILMYGLNILATIIPVGALLSRTPIEIVKKYDI